MMNTFRKEPEIKEPEKIEKPNILLVEGKEDKIFMEALLKHIGLQNIQVLSINGKDNLVGKLESIRKTPGFLEARPSIGIILDGDENPQSTFQSICGSLKRSGLSIPNKPGEFTISGQNSPKVGVYIIPRMLEDLCLEALKGDSSMECVEKFFECLLPKGCNPHPIAKAKIHAFLASREKPGLRLGEAAQSNFIPFDSKAFKKLKDFLSQF